MIAHARSASLSAGRGRFTLFFSAGASSVAWAKLAAMATAAQAEGCDVRYDDDSPFSNPLKNTRAPVTRNGEGARVMVVRSLSTDATIDGRGPALSSPALSMWERIAVALAAGTDVYASLDVTQLASRRDTVFAIIGRIPEDAVPDSMLMLADQILFVDERPTTDLATQQEMWPWQFDHGADHGADHYVALRSLALRCLEAVRPEPEPDVTAPEPAPTAPPMASSTVLAVIGSSDDSDKIVKAAARLAAQLNSHWQAIYIQPPNASYLSPGERDAVQRALALAEKLGARAATVPCLNIAEAVAQYALNNNSRHVVIGVHSGKPWERWPQHLAEMIPALELVMVPIASRRWQLTRDSQRLMGHLSGYALALGGSAAITAAGLAAHPHIANVNIAMLYALLVLMLARHFGRISAVWGAAVSAVSFYFCFVPAYLPSSIGDIQYVMTIAALLIIALATGNPTAALRDQAREAVDREERTRSLYELARALSGVLVTEQVAKITEHTLYGAFRLHTRLLCPDEHNQLQMVSSETTPMTIDHAFAQSLFDESEKQVFALTRYHDNLLYLTLRASMRTRGVLVLQPQPTDEPELFGRERHFEACASLIAIALERIHYAEIAQKAVLRIESERLRNSLLTALSHDLRTPLTALIGLAEGLRMESGRENLQRAVVEINEEVERLNRLVDNLLDMARLQSGSVKLKQEWQSIEEIVGGALYSLRYSLNNHDISTDVPISLPLLRCDAALIERVIANLLENATKYVPHGGKIHIVAQQRNDMLEVGVEDDGPGVAREQERMIFEKFSRGSIESPIPGVGLGLAICRTIIEAHRGRMWLESRAGNGARFVFSLPLDESSPPMDLTALENGSLDNFDIEGTQQTQPPSPPTQPLTQPPIQESP